MQSTIRPDKSILQEVFEGISEESIRAQMQARLDVLQSQGHTLKSRQPLHKIGRNDKCICGSGKKYKKCCLANIANIANIVKPVTFKK